MLIKPFSCICAVPLVPLSGEFCGVGERGEKSLLSVPLSLLSRECISVMFIYGFVVKMSSFLAMNVVP